MKKSTRWALPGLIAAAALAHAAPCLAQVKDYKQLKYPVMRPFTVPQPERTILPNGMVVLMLEDHELPLIQISATIRVDASQEPADKVGLGGIFGQTLRTGGTKSMTGDQLDDFLEARAATIETGVGDESATASASSLTQDFPEVLKAFAEVLRSPAFAEDKIKIARNQLNSGIARRNDNPQAIMNREFDKLVYGASSPWARTAEYATVEKVGRDDLVDFHKRYFVPNRIILGVTGDFDAKAMSGRIREAFGDWPKGAESKNAAAADTAGNKAKPGVYYVQKEDMTQSDIIMGHIGIRRDDPDFFAVEVLNETFGGSFAARLFSNVRSRKGLAYSVRGAVESNFTYPGTFNCWMTTKTETTAAGIDALLTEIEEIVTKPPTAAEVQRAKDSILNSFVFNFDSKSKILRQQVAYEYFGFPSDYLARYRQNVDKVTAEDVARVAKKLIHKEQLAILVVGPSKGQDRPLDSFGKVARVDITIPEPGGATAPAATADSTAKGKALLAKMVEGLGGAAAVDGLKSLHTVATANIRGPMGEVSIKSTSTMKLPDRLRQEIASPRGTVVMVLSGSEGYMDTPGGTQPMPDSRRADIAKSLHRLPIFLAQHRNDPELKVQHIGQENVEGTQAEVLLVSYQGDDSKLYLDPATGRVLRQSYRGQGPAGPGEVVATYSDFRQVSGLTFAFKSSRTNNGEPQDSAVTEEIKVNIAVDEALFAKPAAAPVAADAK